MTWILRRTNTCGPAALFSPKPLLRYRNIIDALQTRLFSAVSPCIYRSPDDRWAKFLHGTRLGRWLVGKIWGGSDRAYLRDTLGIRGEVGDGQRMGRVLTGLEALIPDWPAFWDTNSTSEATNPEFWPLIRSGAVEIVRADIERADIERVEDDCVVLEDGTRVVADVLLCATGWEPGVLKLFTEGQAREYGLPYQQSSNEEHRGTDRWTAEDEEARSHVLERFPMLAKPPTHSSREGLPSETLTAYRLYRALAPLDDPTHTIVILGTVKAASHFMISEVQALWATAYLDGDFHGNADHSHPRSLTSLAPLRWPTVQERRREIARTKVWSELRYLAEGRKGGGLAMMYDVLAYCEILLADLRVESHHRGWGRWEGWTRVLRAGDLRGIIDEWREGSRGRELGRRRVGESRK